MEPLTTIELESCTLVELATLYCLIEAERWVDRVNRGERPGSFANQEKIRRAIMGRNMPTGARGQRR